MNALRTLFVVAGLLLAGCGETDSSGDWQSSGDTPPPMIAADKTTITISDIDPDTPTRRLQILRPLADYIADGLGWDRSRVRVRIGRSIDEMIFMFKNYEADLYLDSGYPASLVAEATGAKLVLGSLVDGSDSYHAMIVASADGPVKTLSDLRGNIIAFQEGYSTSGYLLPAAMLLNDGYELQFLGSAASLPAPDKVGFVFTRDEENTLAMLRKAIVPAGVLSSMDYERLPEEIKATLIILGESIKVPRKLVVLRDGFDPALEKELFDVMLGISDDDRNAFIAANSWNWEFTALDEQTRVGVDAMGKMIEDTRHIILEHRPPQ